MGQAGNRQRCPRGTSERSSQKAKLEKHPVPWKDEVTLEDWPVPWGDTSEGQGGRTWEQGKRDRSVPLSNSWNGMGRRDKGALRPTVTFSGMWNFLWLKEEVALCVREQGELDFLGQWRLLTWELSILSSALPAFFPSSEKERARRG